MAIKTAIVTVMSNDGVITESHEIGAENGHRIAKQLSKNNQKSLAYLVFLDEEEEYLYRNGDRYRLEERDA